MPGMRWATLVRSKALRSRSPTSAMGEGHLLAESRPLPRPGSSASLPVAERGPPGPAAHPCTGPCSPRPSAALSRLVTEGTPTPRDRSLGGVLVPPAQCGPGWPPPPTPVPRLPSHRRQAMPPPHGRKEPAALPRRCSFPRTAPPQTTGPRLNPEPSKDCPHPPTDNPEMTCQDGSFNHLGQSPSGPPTAGLQGHVPTHDHAQTTLPGWPLPCGH